MSRWGRSSPALTRHTRPHPCPICNGFDELPRGHGQRCHGFTGDDGRYARCSRDEHAGTLTHEPSTGLYVHFLAGRCRCGIEHGGGAAPSTALPPLRHDSDDQTRIEKARAIWNRRSTVRRGDPVALYLANRGIVRLPGPDELGFVSDLEYWQAGERPVLLGRFPAMVAPFRDAGGVLTGTLATYLGHQGRKANISPVKKMRGITAAGAIRFGDGPEIVLTEGIENALSVRQATGLPAWAAGSLGGLSKVELPAPVKKVIVVADPKPHEIAGAEAAARRFIAEGRDGRVAYPAIAGLDANETLRKGA